MLQRKALIATYLGGVYAGDDMPVLDFMFLSEQAYAIQEEKRKEAERRAQAPG